MNPLSGMLYFLNQAMPGHRRSHRPDRRAVAAGENHFRRTEVVASCRNDRHCRGSYDGGKANGQACRDYGGDDDEGQGYDDEGR